MVVARSRQDIIGCSEIHLYVVCMLIMGRLMPMAISCFNRVSADISMRGMYVDDAK